MSDTFYPGSPVVIADPEYGYGLPVTASVEGTPVREARDEQGIPVIFVDEGGIPVTLVTIEEEE